MLPNSTKLTSNTYWGEFYKSFTRIGGYILTTICLIVSLVLFIVKDINTVSLKLFIPVIIFLLLFIIILADMSFRMHKRALKTIPSVQQARKPPASYRQAYALLLLEPSELYGHEALASIYYVDDGFEVLIGLGFVLTVQDDELIQVVVTQIFEDRQHKLWKKICNNDKNILAKILVKPTVPKFLLEGGG